MRRTTRLAAACVLVSTLAACAVTSATTDVLVHGRVTDESGHPVAGVRVWVGDLNFTPVYMPKGAVAIAGETTVYTDANGGYSARFKELHGALALSVVDYARLSANCPKLPEDEASPVLGKDQFAGRHDVQQDLVYCARLSGATASADH
jgi:hypothetical protein